MIRKTILVVLIGALPGCLDDTPDGNDVAERDIPEESPGAVESAAFEEEPSARFGLCVAGDDYEPSDSNGDGVFDTFTVRPHVWDSDDTYSWYHEPQMDAVQEWVTNGGDDGPPPPEHQYHVVQNGVPNVEFLSRPVLVPDDPEDASWQRFEQIQALHAQTVLYPHFYQDSQNLECAILAATAAGPGSTVRLSGEDFYLMRELLIDDFLGTLTGDSADGQMGGTTIHTLPGFAFSPDNPHPGYWLSLLDFTLSEDAPSGQLTISDLAIEAHGFAQLNLEHDRASNSLFTPIKVSGFEFFRDAGEISWEGGPVYPEALTIERVRITGESGPYSDWGTNIVDPIVIQGIGGDVTIRDVEQVTAGNALIFEVVPAIDLTVENHTVRDCVLGALMVFFQEPGVRLSFSDLHYTDVDVGLQIEGPSAGVDLQARDVEIAFGKLGVVLLNLDGSVEVADGQLTLMEGAERGVVTNGVPGAEISDIIFDGDSSSTESLIATIDSEGCDVTGVDASSFTGSFVWAAALASIRSNGCRYEGNNFANLSDVAVFSESSNNRFVGNVTDAGALIEVGPLSEGNVFELSPGASICTLNLNNSFTGDELEVAESADYFAPAECLTFDGTD